MRRSFHAGGMGESPKLKLNSEVLDSAVLEALVTLCDDTTQWKAPSTCNNAGRWNGDILV